MKQIFVVLCYLIMAAIILMDYIKDKKTYRLLAVIVILFSTIFSTSLGERLSKPVENLFVGIIITLAFVIFYLIIRDDRKV